MLPDPHTFDAATMHAPQRRSLHETDAGIASPFGHSLSSLAGDDAPNEEPPLPGTPRGSASLSGAANAQQQGSSSSQRLTISEAPASSFRRASSSAAAGGLRMSGAMPSGLGDGVPEGAGMHRANTPSRLGSSSRLLSPVVAAIGGAGGGGAGSRPGTGLASPAPAGSPLAAQLARMLDSGANSGGAAAAAAAAATAAGNAGSPAVSAGAIQLSARPSRGTSTALGEVDEIERYIDRSFSGRSRRGTLTALDGGGGGGSGKLSAAVSRRNSNLGLTAAGHGSPGARFVAEEAGGGDAGVQQPSPVVLAELRLADMDLA